MLPSRWTRLQPHWREPLRVERHLGRGRHAETKRRASIQPERFQPRPNIGTDHDTNNDDTHNHQRHHHAALRATTDDVRTVVSNLLFIKTAVSHCIATAEGLDIVVRRNAHRALSAKL